VCAGSDGQSILFVFPPPPASATYGTNFEDKELELQEPKFDCMTVEEKLIVVQNISKVAARTKYEAFKRFSTGLTTHDGIVDSNLCKHQKPTYPAEMAFWTVCEQKANLGVGLVSEGEHWSRSTAPRHPPSLSMWQLLPVRHIKARLAHYRNMVFDHPVQPLLKAFETVYAILMETRAAARKVDDSGRHKASRNLKKSPVAPDQVCVVLDVLLSLLWSHIFPDIYHIKMRGVVLSEGPLLLLKHTVHELRLFSTIHIFPHIYKRELRS